MNYQLFEKAIYADDDVLLLGNIDGEGYMGYTKPENGNFPDAIDVELGTPIFESTNQEEVEARKRALEIKRMRAFSEGLPLFYNNDEVHTPFFASGNYEKLVAFFEEEFDLELIRTNSYFVFEIGGDGFWIPQEASDETVGKIQELMGIYFFEIKGVGKK